MMTEEVRSRVLSARTRKYVLYFRHRIFGEGEIAIRRDKRGHLIAKVEHQEVHPDFLPEPVKRLCEVLDMDMMTMVVIHGDCVEVSACSGKAWEDGRLNDLIKNKIAEIAASPLPKAA